jgi:hypothetical protein
LAVRRVGFRAHQDDEQRGAHSRPALRQLASKRGSTG